MASRRSLQLPLTELAREKFVLVSGPRQVGKTTLAQSWLSDRNGEYMNWDAPLDRKRILQNEPFGAVGALVLDELHKYARWRSYLKGLYDKAHQRLEVVVTGSARLDVFTRGGDSMFGRYELLRLHPLSIGELEHARVPDPPSSWVELAPQQMPPATTLEQLDRFGGFPEPFYRASRAFHTRWSARRRDLLLREDLRDLTQIRALSLVEHLWLLLQDRVGAPLSINALREEIGVAHETVSTWLEALERLFLIFRLAPYSARRTRSLTKERKLYFLDWSQLADPGARFENLVACHLLKSVHIWSDLGLGEFGLWYWRDREKREVDFVITERRRPVALIESKLSGEALSPSLLYLGQQLGGIPQVQLVRKDGVDRARKSTRIVSADRFLTALC
ncbi:MAG TPA: AAA family ATPase [Polyangiaceae bacterium]